MRTYRRSGFSFRGNIRTYPRSGFRSGGTSAKTTLLETTLLGSSESAPNIYRTYSIQRASNPKQLKWLKSNSPNWLFLGLAGSVTPRWQKRSHFWWVISKVVLCHFWVTFRLGRTPKGAYSSRGRSRHLLETTFSEPLLRTLLRTLFYCKTHSRPPSQNPSENPFPRTLPM